MTLPAAQEPKPARAQALESPHSGRAVAGSGDRSPTGDAGSAVAMCWHSRSSADGKPPHLAPALPQDVDQGMGSGQASSLPQLARDERPEAGGLLAHDPDADAGDLGMARAQLRELGGDSGLILEEDLVRDALVREAQRRLLGSGVAPDGDAVAGG